MRTEARPPCWRCAPLSPDDPDRALCPCGAEVPLHWALLLLEPSPEEPHARLADLQRKLGVANGVREQLLREARHQDRWDPAHAGALRATARRYEHEARRLAREVAVLQPRPTPPAAVRPARRQARPLVRSRRARRAPRSAPRRSVGSRRQTVSGDGGGGDASPGDPEPAPHRAVSATPAGLSRVESPAPVPPAACAPVAGEGHAGAVVVADLCTARVPTAPLSAAATPAVSPRCDSPRHSGVSRCRENTLTHSHPPTLTLSNESESGLPLEKAA